MLRKASYFVPASALVPLVLAAQDGPPDTVRAIAALRELVRAHGAAIGPRIWPGFRPDTVTLHYVIPGIAKLFAPWPDALPAGFFPLPGVPNAAWSDTRTVRFPSGRPIAFLSVDASMSPGEVVGTAIHEAFHAFESVMRGPHRHFGRQENALLLPEYPVFDIEAEAAFALEGRLLRRALDARTDDEARRLVRQCLAVREQRRQRIGSRLIEFERLAELHEGLAQYALLRGLTALGEVAGGGWPAAARRERDREAMVLDSILTSSTRSVRRRFYATGSVAGLVLDRIARRDWKRHVMDTTTTIDDALAAASGYHGLTALESDRDAAIRAGLAALRPEAERAVAALRVRRAAQRDSLLARPGLRIVVDASLLPGGRLMWCSFDPQNVLPTGDGSLMHTRMLRACAGTETTVAFDLPVVEDRARGLLRTVIARGDSLRITALGGSVALPAPGERLERSEMTIAGPGFSVSARRAVLAREDGTLRVTLQP